MNENQFTHTTGILPLVCASCKRTVGIINAIAFARAYVNDDIYICNTCMHKPERDIEPSLTDIDTDAWYGLTWHAYLAAEAPHA